MPYTTQFNGLTIKTDSAEEMAALAKHLKFQPKNLTETYNATRHIAKKTYGHKGHRSPRWTDDEIATLRNNIERPLKDLLVLIPNHTAKAIVTKSWKVKNNWHIN